MSKAKITFIVILVLLLIWLSIYTPPFLNKLKLSAVNLFRLPLRITLSASRNIRDFIGERLYSKWIKENIELKDRLGKLSYEITKSRELEAENERLKKLLEFKNQVPKKSIPTRVIGMDSVLLSRTIFIDRGRNDGIEIGMAVISTRGVVGKVVETNSDISRVMLLEDPDLRLGVIVQRTREQALFVGGLHGKAKIIYLAPNSDVKEGDAIVSCPSNRKFPKGLLLGYIKDISNEVGSLYKSATVKLVVDYSRLEEVLCIR